MKTSRVFALAVTALVIGFVAARWCAAQPSNQFFSKEPESYDFGAKEQFKSFVFFLHDTGQTNILQRFQDYSTATHASQNNADISMTLAVLQRLREGHTEQAYELLEGRLDGDIISFASSYRLLPASVREQPGLSVLGQARDYRAKFPFKHQYPSVDKGVADAFKMLDGK